MLERWGDAGMLPTLVGLQLSIPLQHSDLAGGTNISQSGRKRGPSPEDFNLRETKQERKGCKKPPAIVPRSPFCPVLPSGGLAMVAGGLCSGVCTWRHPSSTSGSCFPGYLQPSNIDFVFQMKFALFFLSNSQHPADAKCMFLFFSIPSLSKAQRH